MLRNNELILIFRKTINIIYNNFLLSQIINNAKINDEIIISFQVIVSPFIEQFIFKKLWRTK